MTENKTNSDLFDGGIGGFDEQDEKLKRDIDKNNKLAEHQRIKALIAKEDTTNEEVDRIISATEITDADEAQPINFALTDRDGKGIFPIGDISAVKGRAKHGKTFFVSMICASLLGCKDFSLTASKPDMKVLLIDTEQHRNNVIQVRNRIKALTKNNLNNFKILALREFAPVERFNVLLKTVARWKPDFVVVDGIVDLISNSNDLEQSQNIVSMLMRISSMYDCHITNVLHMTRTATDGGMRGHLGTELLNKSSDVEEVKRDDNSRLFTATHTDSRNGNIEEICFAVVDGLPLDATTIKAEQAQKAIIEKNREEREKWEQVFENEPYVSYGDLITKIVNHGYVFDEKYRAEDMKTNTAKKRIERAEKMGVIARDKDNLIYIVQR